MGNKGSIKTPLNNMKKRLLDIDLEIIPKIKSKLNIFITGKFGNNNLYKLFVKNIDFNKKPPIIDSNESQNDYEKSKFGIKYIKAKSEYGESYWKFYGLSPIKGAKECEGLINFIKKKVDKNKTQNVIIYTCAENDDNDFELLNQLNNKIEKSSHPFIIFLSKKRKKEDYNHYIIDNEFKNKKFFFDILNIYHLYEENENEIINILWKIYNYYYQLGDIIDNSNYIDDQCLNIYVLGLPGTGKSSFINELFGEKKSLENFGMNITNKVIKYSFIDKLSTFNNKKGRINIFDTPGLSVNGRELKEIKNAITNIFFDFTSNKDLIHCFLYFFNGGNVRTISEDEIELIRYIHYMQKQNFESSKILFVINFTSKTDENDKNSFKNFILKNLRDNFGENSDLSKKENTIEVNLKRDIEKNRILKFGLEEIFAKMYEYFEPHKISINNISRIRENNEINEEEIKNRQIEILNESMFFKFYKKFEDYKNRYISLCEDKIRSSKRETQQIGLFIFRSDKTRCEDIRKNMFEYINDHFKSIFNCDIKYNENDYMMNEDEEFRESFFIKRWFEMKINSPNITEQKGRAYLEKNKIGISNIHNINSCIYLASLYNNSVDLLLEISTNKKLSYIQEEDDIKFIMDVNKAEEQSKYEFNKINLENNIINDSYINNNFSSIKINDSFMSNAFNTNLIYKENANVPKNYIKNDKFIIELDIKMEHPKIKVLVHVIGNYYVFKIKINEKEITLEKSISEIQLEKEKVSDIKKEGNKYLLKFTLKNEDNADEFQF